MIEKVNPSHPDKIADRIAGAIVDLAYKSEAAPKIAVEVLIGHGKCHVTTWNSWHLSLCQSYQRLLKSVWQHHHHWSKRCNSYCFFRKTE